MLSFRFVLTVGYYSKCSTVILDKLTVRQLVKKFPKLNRIKDSLPCSLDAPTSPSHEPDEATRRHSHPITLTTSWEREILSLL
jgi:hypothetical protein